MLVFGESHVSSKAGMVTASVIVVVVEVVSAVWRDWLSVGGSASVSG